MPLLVLDKSVLKAVPKGFLLGLRDRHGFVLTDYLLQETISERIGERDKLSPQERAKLDEMIHANLQKATEEAADEWVETLACVVHELSTGKSARFGPRTKYRNLYGYRNKLTNENLQELAWQEDTWAKIINLEECLEDEKRTSEQLRGLQKKEFFTWLSEEGLRDPKLDIQWTRRWKARAPEHGVVCSTEFAIYSRMLCYGISLTSRAHWYWKSWARPGKPADGRKPVNAYYDLMYVAYMAMADGLLARDPLMSYVAWACWPGKREHIYTYDQDRREIERFIPDWE